MQFYRCAIVVLIGLFAGCASRETVKFETGPEAETAAVHSVLPTPETVAGLLRIHFIDVGQGDCTLIECPNGQHVLVDCGSTRDGDADEVREYLLGQLDASNPKIDLLVITHPDADHYNYLPEVLQGVAVEKLVMVGEASEHPKGGFWNWFETELYADAWILDESYHDSTEQDSEFCGCGDADLFVLAANVEASRSANNARSIVLMVRYGEFDAILTGDATTDTEDVILERYTPEWLDVELLKIGHHGSSTTSTSAEWLAALRPEAATVSAAYNSQYHHPRWEVLDRTAAYTDGAPAHKMRGGRRSGGSTTWQNVNDYTEAIYSTATNGTIVLTSDGDTYELSYEE